MISNYLKVISSGRQARRARGGEVSTIFSNRLTCHVESSQDT